MPTKDWTKLSSLKTFILEVNSWTQVLKLEKNVRYSGLTYFGMADARQGIVHIIRLEQGFTLLGTTYMYGNIHTVTHGGLGAVPFGISTA